MHWIVFCINVSTILIILAHPRSSNFARGFSQSPHRPRVCNSVAKRQVLGESSQSLCQWRQPSHLYRNLNSYAEDEDSNEVPESNDERRQPSKASHIVSIRSKNLAGVKGYNNENEIFLTFEACSEISSNLVAVTGETGSGKSLLVSKVAELVTGGKATASLLHAPKGAAMEPKASVEMALKLYDSSHLSMVKSTLEKNGLDPAFILGSNHDKIPLLIKLKRSLSISNPSGRVKSSCSINDQVVTLKVLKAIGAPLLAVVNAPAAAAALGRQNSRMAMVDSGVPSAVLTWVRQLQTKYNKCRKHRLEIEKELESRILPISMNLNEDDDKDLELLRHWIEELDGFEARMSNVCQSISASSYVGGSSLATVMQNLGGLTWLDNDGNKDGFSSALYSQLLDLSDNISLMDEKVEAATKARDALASLTLPDSATTAIERTRKFLLDASAGEEISEDESKISVASEHAHELLNNVEDTILECASFLDDDEKGLLASLRREREACALSSEDVLDLITEWKTLARKHGISPYVLPSCHSSLRQELNGNVEARTLLPQAIEAEDKALKELEEGCTVLSEARGEVTKRLSKEISQRLPLLGMENSRFEARLNTIDDPSYVSGFGVDEVDFLLFHGSVERRENREENDSYTDKKEVSPPKPSQRGGKVDLVASSGEKARILLAIECEIPGSVRALCGTSVGNGNENVDEDLYLPPVAVIYDEIDAHVGGRASVSVAQMLSDQSRSCQVVSITHSPSVAAIADIHVCIQKEATGQDGRSASSANLVEGLSRRKELARMASGDMASEEAEVFAEALIRDAAAKVKKAQLEPE